jgi:hypothetical protein
MPESDNLIIGIAGVVLSGLTYFAGKAHARRQLQDQRAHEAAQAELARQHDWALEAARVREAGIARVVDAWLDLVRRAQSGGVHALFDVHPEQLPDDAAVREAVRRIEQSSGRSLWGEFASTMESVDQREFFLFMRRHGITFYAATVSTVVDRMKAESSRPPRPA